MKDTPSEVGNRQILTILRGSLERGQTVEIDGLGTFRKAANGYEFVASTQPRVFIAYVEEDLPAARRLRAGLAAAGCSPWMDKDKIMPGQNWPRAIRRAIEISDVFVACFSNRAGSKRGPFQAELRWALRCAERMPFEETFIVPVRLEACTVPRRIADQVHYVDLFPEWEPGLKRVVRAVQRAARAGPKPGCRLERLTPHP